MIITYQIFHHPTLVRNDLLQLLCCVLTLFTCILHYLVHPSEFVNTRDNSVATDPLLLFKKHKALPKRGFKVKDFILGFHLHKILHPAPLDSVELIFMRVQLERVYEQVRQAVTEDTLCRSLQTSGLAPGIAREITVNCELRIEGISKVPFKYWCFSCLIAREK